MAEAIQVGADLPEFGHQQLLVAAALFGPGLMLVRLEIMFQPRPPPKGILP